MTMGNNSVTMSGILASTSTIRWSLGKHKNVTEKHFLYLEDNSIWHSECSSGGSASQNATQYLLHYPKENTVPYISLLK